MGETGGISKKMKTNYFFNYIYERLNSDDLEKIVESHGNTGAQLSRLDVVFNRLELEGFTSEMYHGERVDLLQKIEERALMMNPDLRNIKKKKELGFTEPEANEVPKGAEEEKVRGVVKQRSGKGTEYTRTYNKWDKQEELYLGTRLYDYKHGSVSLNELKMSLKRISGQERTNSSIKTKIKRLGKHDIKRDN